MIYFHALLKVNEANAFIAACPETKQALLIDVGEFNDSIPAFIEEQGLTIAAIFITHNHYDHTSGLKDALDYAGKVPVYAYLRVIEGVETVRVKMGDTVTVGTLAGEVFRTPGHTVDGLTLVFPGHAFTGDALFCGSVGGTADSDDYDRQIEAIRKNIFTLPPDTKLHTGHGPSSTVAIESRYNPFFV